MLNVPAGKMSALPDQSGHFLYWLRSRNWQGAAPDAFARESYTENTSKNYCIRLCERTPAKTFATFAPRRWTLNRPEAA